jgi:hypothetical protein
VAEASLYDYMLLRREELNWKKIKKFFLQPTILPTLTN